MYTKGTTYLELKLSDEICNPCLCNYIDRINCHYKKDYTKDDVIYRDWSAYLRVELRKPTTEDKKNIKEIYKMENSDTGMICYPDTDFSLNKGDYLPPRLQATRGEDLLPYHQDLKYNPRVDRQIHFVCSLEIYNHKIVVFLLLLLIAWLYNS